MKMLPLATARNRFAEVTSAVARSKVRYTLTKHGKPFVKLVPIDDETPRISSKLKRELASVFKRYDSALKELANR